MSTRILSTEAEYYGSIRSQLLATDEGRFALILERELLGVFATFSEAYRHGLATRGDVPMFIQAIDPHDGLWDL